MTPKTSQIKKKAIKVTYIGGEVTCRIGKHLDEHGPAEVHSVLCVQGVAPEELGMSHLCKT